MAWELPPRARRIQQNGDALKQIEGTTSACAENTPIPFQIKPRLGNYLRVRGEFCGQRGHVASRGELPPRARRILIPSNAGTKMVGTTSACAENTDPVRWVR